MFKIRQAIEVTKDHKTLWVNAERCLGRICPFGFEIFFDEDTSDFYHYPKGGITPSDWELFKEQMKRFYRVIITETPPEQLFTWPK
jgi:hypothetical protein